MKSTNHNKISEVLRSFFNEENTFELAQRLEDVKYASTFNESIDLHLYQSLEI